MANTNLTELFTNIANSIRAKDGTSNPIAAINFADRINAIPAGGGSIEYRNYYVNCGTNSAYNSPGQYMDFDVTNANTFTFTYDYVTKSSYPTQLSMHAYLGYKVGLNEYNPDLKQIAVDNGATSQTLCSSLTSSKRQVTVTFDVSNYTTITLKCDSLATQNGTVSYGYVYVYDITLN